MIGKILFIMGMLNSVLLFASCSSVYSSLVDKTSGEQILENEKDVKEFLENILCMPDKYVITAYERCLLNGQKKRTKLLFHSYYVITDTCADEQHTLSFYGTKIAVYSRGVWTMDSDSDTSSYRNYLAGRNNWDVIKIETEDDIDTDNTINNIIKKMSMEITYYYRDHLKQKTGKDNCNTALWETIAYAHDE
jgi:hypothetical protein